MHAAALDVVDSAGLGGPQQSDGVVERARLIRDLRRRQGAPRPTQRRGRKRGGPLQKGSSGGQTAPRLNALGGPLQLCRDILVGPGRPLGEVPRVPVGVDLGVGGIGQRSVHETALIRRRRPIDRRAHERMAKPYSAIDFDQASGLRGLERRGGDREVLGRAPQEPRISERLCRGHQQQSLGVHRQGLQSDQEALLDPALKRQRSG